MTDRCLLGKIYRSIVKSLYYQRKKSLRPQPVLEEISTRINNDTEPESLQLYTDGSVDTDSGHSGSDVYSAHYTES